MVTTVPAPAPPTHPVRAALPSLLALALAACNPDFEPQYRVTDLRILTVRAEVVGSDYADADLGIPPAIPDTLRLTALVANPLGRSPLHVRWRACQPTQTQALPPCLDTDWLRDPSRFDGPDALAAGVLPLELVPSATIAPDGTSVELPLSDPAVQPAIQAAFDALIQFATENPPYQCSLYVELPVVAIAEAGGQEQVAVKRVRLTPYSEAQSDPALRDKYVRNVNPTIMSISLDPADADTCDLGAAPFVETCTPPNACTAAAPCDPEPSGGEASCALAGLDGASHVLCALAPADAIQSFNQCAPDGTINVPQLMEGSNWQWYATGGTFSDADSVGNVTDAHPAFTRPPGPFTLWLILRDGRGGVAWVRRDFSALP